MIKFPNGKKRWEDLTQDEKLQFTRESVERSHKQMYEDALAFLDHRGPAWEDLTDEQRASVREENRQYQRDMQAIGDSIRRNRT